MILGHSAYDLSLPLYFRYDTASSLNPMFIAIHALDVSEIRFRFCETIRIKTYDLWYCN